MAKTQSPSYPHGSSASRGKLIVVMIVAALVEGFLRQLITSTQWRLVIGWGLGLLWVSWLSLSGREVRQPSASGARA